MARTNIPLTAFTPNALTADPTPTAADETNGHVVEMGADWPQSATLEEIVLRVVLASAGDAATVTIVAGANPPADAAGRGDLEVSCPDDDTTFIGPFESARFAQVATDDDAGGLWLDIDDETGVTISAFHLPRTA